MDFPFELDLKYKILQVYIETTDQQFFTEDNIAALIRQGEFNFIAKANWKFEKHSTAADDILNHRR